MFYIMMKNDCHYNQHFIVSSDLSVYSSTTYYML